MISSIDDRHVTDYNDNIGHIQHQPFYSNDEEDVYEEYDEDLDENEDEFEQDDSGSELSIPDPNIDFDMVYALHTFTATVEGQASVVRGDALTLLDDTNSYWWLIKILKTSEIGYIPAENIETPYERLARLNSHRNIELTRGDIQDAFPTPPSNKIKKKKKVTLAKEVQFQSQIIYGSSDEEDEEFKAEFEEWDERMLSDDSEEDEEEEDSDDPYHYYDQSHLSYTKEMSLNQYINDEQQDPIDYYQNINDNDNNSDSDSDVRITSFDLVEEETIKISLTPSIARDNDEDSDNSSSSSIQSKLKKAAKLDTLLGSSDEPTKKKSSLGLRKFFSRTSHKKESHEKRASNGSNSMTTEVASISPQSTTGKMTLDRDNLMNAQQEPQLLKIYVGNHVAYKLVQVYASTTALELIHQVIQEDENEAMLEENAYHDYYIIVKTLGGDEFTLIPSDKPLEIFHSLTTHLNTPMPSLRKAKRISQLMGHESQTYIGGPSSDTAHEEEQVQFFLFSKTKRVDDGEIQIKVSSIKAEDEKRVDKLVKVPSRMLVKNVIELLLEKFHILNGVVTAANDDIKSLRLDGNDTIIEYGLAMNTKDGEEIMLNLNDKILDVFRDDVPPIQYRRSSNPDRTSITVNITSPEKDEIYFILKPIETRSVQLEPEKEEEEVEEKEPQSQLPPQRPHHLTRQDTPIPRQETTVQDKPQLPSMPQYQPQVIVNDLHDVSSSPEEAMFDSMKQPIISYNNDTRAIDTPSTFGKQPQIRPESTDSLLFCQDFGMNDLMIIVRGAATIQQQNKRISHRNEIYEIFKDSQTRLEQLEKELDRIMNETVQIYH
ncbi:uncharacterized protein BX663DRAFT_494813 [Cokeromyces recurvatus]|uniref:uncharacterized protein n=1 Tax=Cokeromyces recurvatus TaxID=90255 RepID=UPI00221F0AE4|nr:uncharacterized protein BX663DRAFT_494813 [Cokeromyces recurvatus]KAI7907095.1 hypothetical protein BX663DRAFT_494813 [Cokeromyces recurvatus]